MRLNVHDYSGHPFQVQLSRELAGRGHFVVHEFSTQYVTGHGRLQVGPDDPPTLRIEGVTAAKPLRKYDPVGRAAFELSYARAWQRRLRQEQYDVVVASNVPLVALDSTRRYLERHHQPWVLWHQDLYSEGVASELERRLPRPLASGGRSVASRMEREQVRSAQRVVAIHPGFPRHYEAWGLPIDHVEVIPNWAPLDDIAPGKRDNAWALEQGLPSAPLRLMYAGTLGRKHNPFLLLDLLNSVRARGIDAILIVCSEGVGAEDLRAAAGPRPDVRIFGYQPADRFSDVLASADAMVVLLEPTAATYSVPSKVFSYLAAGRPTMGLLPRTNAAAADIRAAGGFVADATTAGADDAATWLSRRIQAGSAGLSRLGYTARDFALRRFDIEKIADQFEAVLADACPSAAAPARARIAGGSADGWLAASADAS